MNAYDLYSQLIKPTWAPPGWIFGPVWTVLYIVILISYGYVGIRVFRRQVPISVLAPFVLNIIFNLAFTPLQFGLQDNILASIDIILVLGTLVWALVAIRPHITWVSYSNIPYLLWVCFATVLQLTITFMNL